MDQNQPGSETQNKDNIDQKMGKRHDRKATNGNRSLLHLVAESVSSVDSADRTEISWKTSLQEGRSLEVHGRSVRVKHSGIYSIYSQVFYRDVTFTMGHLVLRRSDYGSGESETLLSCVQSMPSDDELAYNTCYTSGVFRLNKGNSITLEIPRRNATLVTQRQATFLGFIKL
ncbi:PREDICTED: tumor necrosis factor ligand superfamily member 13-like [Nanorana parkeri]|uniref:tumor necrosis factor ligand superfamily member 13-like n=1 Tax=Nanorana parkeri TaxID=125878 RepID=UPI0008549D34|nr:PREDICTED: tumor necrosis factor ligand superfamily member 13-like [Nanorana parkeri]